MGLEVEVEAEVDGGRREEIGIGMASGRGGSVMMLKSDKAGKEGVKEEEGWSLGPARPEPVIDTSSVENIYTDPIDLQFPFQLDLNSNPESILWAVSTFPPHDLEDLSTLKQKQKSSTSYYGNSVVQPKPPHPIS